MGDLISRQSLVDALNKFAPEHYTALVNNIIMKEPSAQRTGKWEKHIFDGTMGSRPSAWMCDQCNSINIVKTDYCPNCGARMKGGE